MATSVKLDDELKDRIQKLAKSRDRSSHWIMREAISEYVTREELRESFKQEALDSWKEYQETGLHITLEETREWLKTWGTENETGPPECHT
jgi:predicted transcriptional regulator